jgi:hypothetical protein
LLRSRLRPSSALLRSVSLAPACVLVFLFPPLVPLIKAAFKASFAFPSLAPFLPVHTSDASSLAHYDLFDNGHDVLVLAAASTESPLSSRRSPRLLLLVSSGLCLDRNMTSTETPTADAGSTSVPAAVAPAAAATAAPAAPQKNYFSGVIKQVRFESASWPHVLASCRLLARCYVAS